MTRIELADKILSIISSNEDKGIVESSMELFLDANFHELLMFLKKEGTKLRARSWGIQIDQDQRCNIMYIKGKHRLPSVICITYSDGWSPGYFRIVVAKHLHGRKK